MRPVRTGCALVVALAVAAPAVADVTFKRKMDTKGAMGGMSGTSVQFIKGTKMREDTSMMGGEVSNIVDVATQQMIMLNHKTKEAQVYDMAKLTADAAAMVSPGDVQAKLTPTSETREVAGISCTVHTMDMTAPTDMGGQKMTVHITGPVCLAKNGPGQAEVAAFYKAMADKGLFFGDVRQAKAQPGQARSMTAMYREMTEAGIPLAQEMTMKVDGEGPMAAMMAKMGGITMVTEVLSVSTDPIPDSMFEIPAGYKVVKR